MILSEVGQMVRNVKYPKIYISNIIQLFLFSLLRIAFKRFYLRSRDKDKSNVCISL